MFRIGVYSRTVYPYEKDVNDIPECTIIVSGTEVMTNILDKKLFDYVEHRHEYCKTCKGCEMAKRKEINKKS